MNRLSEFLDSRLFKKPGEITYAMAALRAREMLRDSRVTFWIGESKDGRLMLAIGKPRGQGVGVCWLPNVEKEVQ